MEHGRCTAVGRALAAVAASSLLAAPLLPRLGGLTVTMYGCGLAAGQLFTAAALVRLAGGPPVLRPPTGTELAALVYLAVAVTAVVFLAWFAAVQRLGVERAGLFNGLIPVASLVAVAVSGTGTVTGVRLAGALGVLAGLVLGLGSDRAAPSLTPAGGSVVPSGARSFTQGAQASGDDSSVGGGAGAVASVWKHGRSRSMIWSGGASASRPSRSR
jgi:hypothetical protein